MRAIVVVVVMAGCLEPRLLPCGDRLCPPGAVCLSDGRCASEEAVAACTGLADGAVCQTPLFDGTCAGGACTAPRCGDGIAFGAEQCDGAVTAVDCVDFGFDLGVPACSETCTLDLIAGCTRFGWRRKLAVSARALWIDGVRLAFVRDDRAVEIRHGDQVLVDSSEWWDGVTGNAQVVLVWEGTRIATSDGGPLVDIAPPAAAVGGIDFVAIAANGALAVASNPGCLVHHRPPAGAWTEIRGQSPGDCSDLTIAGDTVAIATNGGLVDRWSPGTGLVSVAALTEPVNAVMIRGSEIWIGARALGVLRSSGGALSTVVGGTDANGLADGGDAVYYLDVNGNVGRILGSEVEHFLAPIGGELFADASRRLYTYGNGLYEFTGMTFGLHDGVTGPTHDLRQLPDGSVYASLSNDLYRRDSSIRDWVYFNAPLEAERLAGRAWDDLYVATLDELYHFDGRTFVDRTPPGFTGIRDVWAPPAGEPSLYAVGDNQRILARTPAGWMAMSPPAGATGCRLDAIDGNATDVFAVGECGGIGVVWQLVAGAWTEVYRGGPPLVAVTTTSDGEAFAAGPAGGLRTLLGAWVSEPGAQGRSITATSSRDVFVGGGPGDIVRWDGTSWSRLATIGATAPRAWASPRAVYMVGAVQSVLLR